MWSCAQPSYSEPDKIATGIGYGPRLLVSQEALRATGLVQPGSLVRFTYRINLPEGAPDAALEAIEAEAARTLPEAGWEIRSRVNADPRFARNIERFSQFLTLVGLTALLVGGVGVANAVRGFVDRKRVSIATMKSLGAPGGQVVAIYLVEVMLIAAFGIAIGLGVGAVLPFLVAGLFGHLLPIPIVATLAFSELGVALLYGALARRSSSRWRRSGARTTCKSPGFSAIRSIPSGAGRANVISSRSASPSRSLSTCGYRRL